MSNREAIVLLRNLENALDSYCELNEEGKNAFRMAIESLELFGNSERLPSAQPERKPYHEEWISALRTAEPDRKAGRWLEKEVIHKAEAKTVIEEWQSCTCSVCGRYDTRPYLYYFDEPHFCSWCGADMRGKDHTNER